MPSAIFDCWDTAVVPYPFVEVLETKQRPVVVLTNQKFHQTHGVCFAAMVTTARGMTDVRPDDIRILDLETAGLKRPCVIRASRLMTIDIADGMRRIGRLAEQEQARLRIALLNAFSWDMT